MDLKSLSLGERIAAASGAVLFLLLFVSWLEGLSAWELFDIVDVLLAILALAAVALPLARAAGREVPLRPSIRTVLIRLGAVALTLILAYFLEGFASAQVGLWLSVLAAVGILYGATTIPGEDAPAGRRDRTRRPRAEEGFEEPPPGTQSWREGARSEEGAEESEFAAPPERPGGGSPPADRAGASPQAPPSAAADRPGRERGLSEPPPEFDPEPGRTEVREPRRPPEVPPGQGR